MGEVMNEGRFDGWRRIMDPMTPEPEGTSPSRLVIGKLIDEAEAAAQWRKNLDLEVKLIDTAFRRIDQELFPEVFRRLKEVETAIRPSAFAPLMTMYGVQSEEVRCGNPEPHDAHGVDMGVQGFWCPGVPLVEESDEGPEEGYTRFTVSTPMPPANDAFSGVASLTTDNGQTFVTAEYAAQLMCETARHNGELRDSLSTTRAALDAAFAELEHLRDFKRRAHLTLDEVGVDPHEGHECRIVARIQTLHNAHSQAERQVMEQMSLINDHRMRIDELINGYEAIRSLVMTTSQTLPAKSQGGNFLLTIARHLDDKLPGYTRLWAADMPGVRYPEVEEEFSSPPVPLGSKVLLGWRDDVVIRRVDVWPGTNVVMDPPDGEQFDRVTLADP